MPARARQKHPDFAQPHAGHRDDDHGRISPNLRRWYRHDGYKWTVAFFMHLWQSKPLVQLVAAVGFFWLAVLLALTFSDYASRDWLGAPLRSLPDQDRLEKQ